MSRGPDNFTAYMHIVWLSSIFYNACLGFIKVSVLALYMRLEDKSLRRLAIVMLGVVICQVRRYDIVPTDTAMWYPLLSYTKNRNTRISYFRNNTHDISSTRRPRLT